MNRQTAGEPDRGPLPVRHPDWAAPARVAALFTTRSGGVSTGQGGDRQGGNGLNLGANCGDSAERVASNRRRLAEYVGGPVSWLNQVHGTRVVEATADRAAGTPESADAQVATASGVALAVLVADCLPVLLADRAGTVVGAAHAGWRGLSAGVLENTVAAMRSRSARGDLVAWLGPCIGASAFEVGKDVLEAFTRDDAAAAALFRTGARPGKWWADLAGLARRRLDRLGVTAVSGAGACTVTERDACWSYRRDGACGRMAAVIWLRG
jgi:YfiH family protein